MITTVLTTPTEQDIHAQERPNQHRNPVRLLPQLSQVHHNHRQLLPSRLRDAEPRDGQCYF